VAWKTSMMRTIGALALLAGASACSTVSYDFGDLKPSTSSSSTTTTTRFTTSVTYPRFDDRKPHPWEGRGPTAYPIHGTDVSKYQPKVDWVKARDSGVSFAFIKATEGGDRIDDRFVEHWRNAAAAGIPRSAYHFYYFCRSAQDQANWFIRNVPHDPQAMPHVLDMEWNHLSPTCKKRPPAHVVQSEMRIFLDMLTRHYGKKPIIYTSIDFYEDNRLHEFKGYQWWLRSVSAHPKARYGTSDFLFWQYTGTGRVPGIRGDADINVFNGSQRDWQAWLKANTG
jgi:lysozyme